MGQMIFGNGEECLDSRLHEIVSVPPVEMDVDEPRTDEESGSVDDLIGGDIV